MIEWVIQGLLSPCESPFKLAVRYSPVKGRCLHTQEAIAKGEYVCEYTWKETYPRLVVAVIFLVSNIN